MNHRWFSTNSSNTKNQQLVSRGHGESAMENTQNEYFSKNSQEMNISKVKSTYVDGCQNSVGFVVFDRKMRKDNRHFASQTKHKPKSVKNIVFCVWNKSDGFNIFH